MNQVEISFEGGLQTQFPDFFDCVRASVSGCGRAHKAVAADLDMSSSELSRKLAQNPNDQVNFPLSELPALMRSTGDLRPLYWVVEEFLRDPEAKRKQAGAELMALLPRIQKLLESSQ